MTTYEFTEIDDFDLKGYSNLDQSIDESYSFKMEEVAETVGGDIYFSPLLFLKLEKNPFALEDRSYPVDFVYPKVERKIISIRIPDGYKVKSMPEAIRLSLPENMGSFVFNISETQGTISIRSNCMINRPAIPTHYYSSLREFYSKRVAKENEKIVLTKI